MAPSLADSIARLNSVAMGDRKADMVLDNCRLLSVYTGEVIPDTQIAIAGDRIAYVGPDAGHVAGPKTVRIDLGGRYAGPGLADPHLHMDQFVMPSEFVKRSLLCGVTSLFSDPIDIVSVAGYDGFKEFLRHTKGLPARVFHTVPGGLPVDTKFSSAMTLSPAQEKAAVNEYPEVVGMGEVFSWTKVTARDRRTMESLSAMLDMHDCAINGHTAGASGRKLEAYVASGILSCHEPINYDQALERLRLGMSIMIREGSIRRDLAGILGRVLSEGTYTGRLMFCSDGLDPQDMERTGHIDHCIREAVRLGMEPVDALCMASRNVFDYYRMSRDLGGIAPGKLADILVYDDLESFRPNKVFVGGRLAVSNGSLVARIKKRTISPQMRKTVRLPGNKVKSQDFVIKAPKRPGGRGSSSNRNDGDVTLNTIRLQTEIITSLGSAVLAPDGDMHIGASPDSDVCKVAALDRIHGTGRRCVGFLENFGATGITFASTWSFHENDMIVIGSDDSDMAAACNHLIRNQGGLAVVKAGRVLASLPLQFAGIVSTAPFWSVLTDFENVTGMITDAGCRFARPHLIPLFLPFLALPSVRILSSGIVDVRGRRYVSPVRNAGQE